MKKDDVKKILEGLLLVSDDVVKLEDVVKLIPTKKEIIKESFNELILDYRGRGIEVIEIAGGYSFATNKNYSLYIENFLKVRKKTKLSKAALEVLAIVAYKEPVTRVEIDTIRGVDSGHVLRGLLEKKLIKPVGKKDVPGKPLQYG